MGEDIAAAVERVAQDSGFSGAVRVDVEGTAVFARAYGFAVRGWQIPNAVDTRFNIASGTKGLTALTVLSLVEDGVVELSTPVRTLLGADLSLIEEGVTVEHLLAHRSGIGDYLDEDAQEVDDYVMPVPVHRLDSTESYLAVLDGHATVFPPGERFAYCNGGFVVLALCAERAAGKPFAQLLDERVCRPAGLTDTAFLRSDQLPGRTALGYLEGFGGRRTNVHHLPVCGSGDGGVYTTLADLTALWAAVFDGRIVSRETVAEMVRPRSAQPDGRSRYGLGFWLSGQTEAVLLEGYDAGVSFRSLHFPTSGSTGTVVSNTSEGAWPVAREVERLVSR